MNNYEKITDMTMNELARFLSDITHCKSCPIHNASDNCNLCVVEFRNWLEEEVKR